MEVQQPNNKPVLSMKSLNEVSSAKKTRKRENFLFVQF